MKKGFVFTMYIMVLLILFSSCQNKTKNHVIQLVREWEGKEIQFPPNSVFTIQGKDTIKHSGDNCDYKIVTYIDSIGCTSCKLQLQNWKDFILKMDSLNHDKVSFLLLAIGNPIHNPKIRELYVKIIRGESIAIENESKDIKTEVATDKVSILLGVFDWQKEQKAIFTLKNIGDNPLVIQDVATSCGCTTVAYSKEPALPGKEIDLEVVYKAEHPEHFDKTITVYCNAETSPLVLKISGDAK